MTWEPIITSVERRKILTILDQFAELLIANKSETDIIGLFSGKVGEALFLYYYYLYTRDKESLFQAKKIIGSVLSIINSGFNRSTFGGGISGIAWCIEHLKAKNLINSNEVCSFSVINSYFSKEIFNHSKKGNFDFIYGSTGIVNYFLDWKSSDSEIIVKYIDTLENFGESDEDSIKWKSVIEKEKNDYGYNLSLSHGISAIIVILSKILKSKINCKKTEKLLRKSINFILSTKQDTTKYISNFPNLISRNKKEGDSRLAWCYGDLGIGIALYQTAVIINDSALKQEAINILLHSATRIDLKENSVIDASLCHGTAGIAHVFNRMYNYTGIEDFKKAALYWIEKTLEMAKFPDGLAGYKTWKSEKYGGWVNEPGLLEGIAGIGLMLISALSDIEPKWDRCLLLS